MKKFIDWLKLVWKRTIGDNFTDSNGDTDIVRVLATAAVIMGLYKYSKDTGAMQDIGVAIAGLIVAWGAKKADPKVLG